MEIRRLELVPWYAAVLYFIVDHSIQQSKLCPGTGKPSKIALTLEKPVKMEKKSVKLGKTHCNPVKRTTTDETWKNRGKIGKTR